MDEARPTSPRAHLALAVLFMVYVINFVDRQILAILIEPIKAELGASDTAMGFLTGTAFALFYALAGLPIARISDLWSRRGVLMIGLTLWSSLTALSGLVTRFWQLALLRVGVGVGEASSNPASHALIAQMYGPQRRATALAVFSMGAHAGIMLGLLFGGYVAHNADWRTALIIAGLAGLPLVVLVRFFVPDLRAPVATESSQAGTSLSLLRDRRYRLLCAGASLSSLPGYALVIWGATHLIRVHGLDLADAGWWFGLAAGIGGALGTLLGGVLADRLGTRGGLGVPQIASLLTFPAVALFAVSGSLTACMAGALLMLALGPTWMGPVYAGVQSEVPRHQRARAAALLILFINLVGLGVGPLLVGMLSDLFTPASGDGALGYALFAVSLLYLGAAECYRRARLAA